MNLCPQHHPVGSRVLVNDRFNFPSEILLVEWSPENRLKVRRCDGGESWWSLETLRLTEVLEVLPPTVANLPVRFPLLR